MTAEEDGYVWWEARLGDCWWQCEVVIIGWLVLSLSVGVESFAESEGEVTRVVGRNGCRFMEWRTCERAALGSGREHVTRVLAGSGIESENLPHGDVHF